MNNEITPDLLQYLDAIHEFGWDGGGSPTNTAIGILYGIQLAFQHPEWAQALAIAAHDLTDTRTNDPALAEVLSEFVARAPMTGEAAVLA